MLTGTVIGAATPDWINVTDSPYHADPTGQTDASRAINAAITAAPKGGVVYLPTGIFLAAASIVIQKSVTLLGDHGATTVIQVASTFANPPQLSAVNLPTAAILCLDHTPGSGGAP